MWKSLDEEVIRNLVYADIYISLSPLINFDKFM
jgi:hypothetical protein